jgi:hypothetical protein
MDARIRLYISLKWQRKNHRGHPKKGTYFKSSDYSRKSKQFSMVNFSNAKRASKEDENPNLQVESPFVNVGYYCVYYGDLQKSHDANFLQFRPGCDYMHFSIKTKLY